jgi:hypothetical protein
MSKMVWLIGLRRTLCVMAALVVTGCGTQAAGGNSRSAASDDAPLVLKDVRMYYIDDDPAIGIHVEGQFTPDRDGTTTGPATINMAGRSLTAAFLYPPNWDTDQWPPDAQQSLRSGHPMAVNEDVIPACDGAAHDPPLISVPYRTAEGAEATLQVAIPATGTTTVPFGKSFADDKSIPDSAAYIDDATRQFCSHDVLVVTGPTSGNVETGEASIGYNFTNPGPGTLTVMSKAWQEPNGSRWLATSPIEVPADGQSHRLMVQGVDGICDEPHQTPMSLGLLVVTYPDGGSKVIQRPEEIRDECQTRDGVIPP